MAIIIKYIYKILNKCILLIIIIQNNMHIFIKKMYLNA